MKSFENRVCVITGAASGIGLALAKEAAKRHMKIVLSDIDEKALSRALNGPFKGYQQIKTIPLDVTERDSMKNLHNFAYTSFGAVHLVFLNAGARGPDANIVTDVSDEELEWIIELNHMSVLRGLRVFTKSMHQGGEEGCIVATSSIYGLGPSTDVYGLTKTSVISLVETFQHALENIGSKIRCAALCPSFVSTELGKRRYKEQQSRGASESQKVVNALLRDGDDPGEAAEAAFTGIEMKKTYIHTRPGISKALMNDRFESVIVKQKPFHKHHDEIISRLLKAGQERRKLEGRCYVDGKPDVARL